MDLAVASVAPPAAGPPPTAPREEAPRATAFEGHLKADLTARDSTSVQEDQAENPPEAVAELAPDQPIPAPVVAITAAAAAIDLQLLGGPQTETAPGEETSQAAPLAPSPAAVQAPPQSAKPPASKSAPAQPDDAPTTAPSAESRETAAAPAAAAPAAPSAQNAAPAPPALLVAAQAAAQTAKPAPSTPETQAAEPTQVMAASKPDAAKRNTEFAAKIAGKSAAPERQGNFELASAQLPLAQPDAQSPGDLQLAPVGSAASHAQQAGTTESSAARAAPAAAQVASEIIRRFTGQSTQFDLRLDPPELGRVEVRLEVSRDHRVTATVTADNPQALAELARHARELQQTLQSAGLELSDAGLSFDLRQGSDGARQSAGDRARAGTPPQIEDDEFRPPPIQARPVGFERWRGMRVDMIA